jgi:hypothetical protein
MATHDIFYPAGPTQSVTVTSALGASTLTFGAQTRAIRIAALGTTVNSNSWVFMKLGTPLESVQASSTSAMPIVINAPEVFRCRPGQQASLITGDAATSYRCYVTELDD